MIIVTFIELLPPQLYQDFSHYLNKNHAELSLKLIKTIHQNANLHIASDSETLCKTIYGQCNAANQKKLYQLAYHTFRLGGYIIKNYPNFLSEQISVVETYFNEGKVSKAVELCFKILDVAEKIEDFITVIKIYPWLIQHYFLKEDKVQCNKMIEKYQHAISLYHELSTLFIYLRTKLNYKERKNLNQEEITQHETFFKKYMQSKSLSVSIIASYGYYYALSLLGDPRFYNKISYDGIKQLIETQKKNHYLSNLLHDDILLYTEYLHLKQMLGLHIDEEQIEQSGFEIIDKKIPLKFWKGYVNTPVIMDLSVLASYYVSKYFEYILEPQKSSKIEPRVKEKLITLKHFTESMMQDAQSWKDEFNVRYINLSTIYCCFLLLAGKKKLKRLLIYWKEFCLHTSKLVFRNYTMAYLVF
ncbi:MAG: hypothetical protein N2167_10930 [Flavobacteriales bacterium]|nr:hypothetical protein [Flavobacteriales bacterium]